MIVKAESKCSKLNMGMVPYFPVLVMKANSVIFWKAIKRHEEGEKVKITYFIRMTRITEYHGSLSKGMLTLETIRQKINNTENEYMVQNKPK